MKTRFFDPLKNWHELIPMIRFERLEKLEGDGLLALDYRVAAEILLRFYDDLADHGAAPPLERPDGRVLHPLDVRLRADSSKLDAVLMDFGLSPHPGVVLVLEGETEMTIVPKVMEFLRIPRRRNFIQLIEAGGVHRNLDLLAEYVAAPHVGEPLGNGVRLVRPPTRFVVAFDPEHRFTTPEDREVQKQRWVDILLNALPLDLRNSVVLEDLKALVHVDAWDQTFEFAHFKDGEIAQAINRINRRLGASRPNVLAAHVRSLRRSANPDVSLLWKRGGGSKPGKPLLAEELWPKLERRLEALAAENRIDEIPIARVLIAAYRLARETPRHGVMLRTSVS